MLIVANPLKVKYRKIMVKFTTKQPDKLVRVTKNLMIDGEMSDTEKYKGTDKKLVVEHNCTLRRVKDLISKL